MVLLYRFNKWLIGKINLCLLNKINTPETNLMFLTKYIKIGKCMLMQTLNAN